MERKDERVTLYNGEEGGGGGEEEEEALERVKRQEDWLLLNCMIIPHTHERRISSLFLCKI